MIYQVDYQPVLSLEEKTEKCCKIPALIGHLAHVQT